MGMLMQFLVNQKGKIEKKLSFEIKNIISRTALDLFTRDFLIHKSILMALFPQAFTLSTKATDIFSRFALHFEAMEQDILQQGFRSILPARPCIDSVVCCTGYERLRSNVSRKSLDYIDPKRCLHWIGYIGIGSSKMSGSKGLHPYVFQIPK